MTENVHAYIDGANLHNAIKQLAWDFDYARFRVWLKDKYKVSRAYMFLGLIPEYTALYTKLQEQGYTLVLKPVTYDKDGKPKGNCDADLVVKVMRDAYENNCDKIVLVSSDGDYASLVDFLLEKNKMRILLSPSAPQKCSLLLKRTGVPIAYVCDQQSVLQKIKGRPPIRTESYKGSTRSDEGILP
ncbi:MAG: NYN domain-containing protein [Candidatus Gracilibacteria bacterium]